jgi:hypothetical protein
MASLRHRLAILEARLTANSRRGIPPEVRQLFREVAREREGRRVPRHTLSELEHLQREDLEEVSGRGMVADLRGDVSWQSHEAQDLLDEWEEGARERLARVDDLPPERWHEVYE